MRTPRDRFLSKVVKTDGCWIWTDKPSPEGYGRFRFQGKFRSAHVASYLIFVGVIPDGLEIDHLCHTRDADCPGGPACPHRLCVNPEHLEAVTHQTNMLRSRGPSAIRARKTHCWQGHPYDEENTYRRPDNSRDCKICKRAADQRFKAARKAKLIADSKAADDMSP